MPNTIIDDAPQALADRRSADIADLVAPQIQCLQGGIVPVRAHTHMHSTRSDDHPHLTEEQKHTRTTPTPNTMIDDAPQALADRRSADIADLVAVQIQCLQGGIVPVRAHTLHDVGSLRAPIRS